MAERNYVREYLAAQKAKPKNSMADIIRQLRAGFDNNPDNRNMLSDKYLYDRSAIYKSLKDAVTAPMRAYEGEFDVNSPFAVQEALNTAGVATLGGFPGGARGPGSVGATVWHGSPHKFDRFDMSKIGTGEGAQAYGHGLYMAEAPEVAQSYVGKASTQIDKRPDGSYLAMVLDPSGNPFTKQSFKSKELAEAFAKENQAKFGAGSMYKVDIPDEAVARMLDWDKPLSQQAPGVQAALNEMGLIGDPLDIVAKRNEIFTDFDAGKITREQRNVMLDNLGVKFNQDTLGQTLYMRLGDQAKAAELLKAKGIQGIKYLDGFSRGPQGGSGTNNFVLFDDQLPRILERNGVPTGLQPWAPGEANALLGILEQQQQNDLASRIPWIPIGAGTLAGMLGMSDDAEANALLKYLPR